MKLLSAAALLALALAGPASAAESLPQKTSIESAHFDMQTVGTETRFVFGSDARKRVTLVGTNMKIVCDNLEIIAVGIGDDSTAAIPTMERFKYLLATGNVSIVQGDREATCGRAEVFPKENKIELTEKPVVIDRGSGWTGQGRKITMHRGDRRVQIEESLFEGPEIRDLGFDAGAPAPAPTAPAAPGAATKK